MDNSSHHNLNGTRHVESQSDEACEGEKSHRHLVEKIRADRMDLEQKIQNIKNHIETCSKVMKQLKKRPDNKEKYDNLTKTRASLVANAVHLQQLLKKLKQSESQAGQLADREQILTSEFGTNSNGVDGASSNGAPPISEQESSTPKSTPEKPEEEEKETKEELMRRIKHSQTQLRIMESQQQKLRTIKEEIQKKLTLSKLREIEIVPVTKNDDRLEQTKSFISMSPSQDESALREALNGSTGGTEGPPGATCSPHAGSHSPRGPSEPPDPSDLQSRLAALQQRREQLDTMVQHLATLQQSAVSDPCPPPLTVDVDGCASTWEERNARTTLSQHRFRLQQLEHTLHTLTNTLHSSTRNGRIQPAGGLPSPEEGREETVQQVQLPAQQEVDSSDQKVERDNHQPEKEDQQSTNKKTQQATLDLPCSQLEEKKQEMELTRRQLLQARQLMSAVELARASGQRLSTCVPRELTQLLSQQSASADRSASQQHISKQQASEYVTLLKNMTESVDFLQEVNDGHNKTGELQQDSGKQVKLNQR